MVEIAAFDFYHVHKLRKVKLILNFVIFVILVHYIFINSAFRVDNYLGMRSLKRILDSIVNGTVTLLLTEGHDENEV